MNNEEKILFLLEGITGRLEKLETGQTKLASGQANLQKGIDEIKMNVKYLWEDINRLNERLHTQEEIVEKSML